MTTKGKERVEEFRLFKHRFNDNWHIEVTTPPNFWCSPELAYWTKCLKVAKLDEMKAEKYFGHLLEEGSFEISNDYKLLIFGK